MKKAFLIVFFLHIYQYALTQNSIIDSLKRSLQSETSSISKGNSYYQLAEIYRKNIQYDSAYYFSNNAYKILKKQQSDSLHLIALLQLYRLSGKTTIIDTTDYLNLAIHITKLNPNKSLLTEVFYAQGLSYYYNNEHANALPYFLRIDSISKLYNIKNKTVVSAILHRSEISRLKFTEKNTQTSEKLLLEALQTAQDIKSDYMIHLTYTYLADVYNLMERNDESKKYIDLALNYFLKTDDIRNVSQTYLLSTAYYLGIDDLENAKKEQTKRIDYLRTKDDSLELGRALVYNGSFHRRKTKQFDKAIESLLEAKAIYENLKMIESDSYERIIYSLAICNSEIGNYKAASTYFDYAYDLREDVIKKENRTLTTELETKYQTDKKEQEIKLLSAENQLAKKQNYIYIGIALLLLLTGLLLFFVYRNKIETAQKLNELNDLKSRFFANISHEFRTPLTLIKSPIQSLILDISDEDHLSKLEMIDKNSNRMLELVNQLLELSKIDSGHLKLIFKEANLKQTLSILLEPFHFEAKLTEKTFNMKLPKVTENNYFDKDCIEKIATNLLSNAFKYTSKNDTITFDSNIEFDKLELKVSNTGSSLNQKDLPRLFDRFYQKNESHQGSGIGLSLVKELVALYGGNIICSLENDILSFTVTLPLNKNNPNAVIVNEENNVDITPTNASDENEQPILLIIDDNPDIRTVLSSLFKNEFSILLAENGVLGLKLAKKHIPDCIICDVMMPEMDGLEFTKIIKTNELTSFIPVLLLTAKASEKAHLEGLKNKADAFLTKPFNNEIINQTVTQLIQERKKLQERYSQELILKPTDVLVDSYDEKFISKLQDILDTHISNAKFTAEEFASLTNLSRMQLHRKLKTLFGVSTSEFIRNERVKIASEHLKKENISISEVGYAVGFNDISYFAKCFKEVYNVTPTEYQKLHS